MKIKQKIITLMSLFVLMTDFVYACYNGGTSKNDINIFIGLTILLIAYLDIHYLKYIKATRKKY